MRAELAESFLSGEIFLFQMTLIISAAPPQIGLLGFNGSTPPQIDLLGAMT